MSASPDPVSAGRVERPGAVAGAWRVAGGLYLGAMLAGLAAGLWPEAIFPPTGGAKASPLPVLQSLAVAQVAFVLLMYPLVLLCRAERSPALRAGYWRSVVAESFVLLVVSVPFYIPAAFLADAVAADVVRTAACVASVFPLAWAAGGHFAARRRAPWAVLLALVLIALGLPAVVYVALEFFPAGAAAAPGNLSPLVFAWRTAAARLPGILPRPLWAWLVWPVAAICLSLGMAAAGRRREPDS